MLTFFTKHHQKEMHQHHSANDNFKNKYLNFSTLHQSKMERFNQYLHELVYPWDMSLWTKFSTSSLSSNKWREKYEWTVIVGVIIVKYIYDYHSQPQQQQSTSTLFFFHFQHFFYKPTSVYERLQNGTVGKLLSASEPRSKWQWKE